MSIKHITITKASAHNLKQISAKIPHHSLCVITGPSGSGKSSLAFDTIYVEGQRRYIESLSSYARQFLGQFQPPEVESITGLSPAIAIDQKSTIKNPRSTVGTITEIYDYMRVLYARIGEAHSPTTGKKIIGQTAQQISKTLLDFPKATKLIIMAPIIRNQKGEHRVLLNKFLDMGFSKIRIDSEITALDDQVKIDKRKYHNIELVIDRILVKEGITSRLTESVELGLKFGQGFLTVIVNNQDHFFSEKNYCPKSNQSFPDLEPRLFSFNSPLGACPSCSGIGRVKQFTKDSIIEDSSLSLLDGAAPILSKHSFLFHMVKCIAKKEKINIAKPFNFLPESFKKTLFSGSEKQYSYSFESENSTFRFKKSFPGISSWLQKKYRESSSEKIRLNLEQYMDISLCDSCKGHRLSPYALAVLVGQKNISTISNLPIDTCLDFFFKLKLKGEKKKIAEKLLKEIIERLTFLKNVGLSYLSLSRSANTLSGGESQRIRLATQIGSALTGVLYVLDEPSIGLHSKDNKSLIKTLKNLKNLGNTIIVVEHDEETIKASDYIIDMGPGAGVNGGHIIAAGSLSQVLKNKKSLTAKYLNKELLIPIPQKRRPIEKKIEIIRAKHNNLKSIDVMIPLNTFVCITGVSGSGKSTLVHNVLIPGIKKQSLVKNYSSIKGAQHIQSLIELDQSPIGRTPKSNPATYSGAFGLIRVLFSNLPESKARGYKQGRFSFNVKGGRCDHCEGNGLIKVEMHFLANVFITCSHCQGRRYNDETLNILYKGHSISDILNMTINQAQKFFINHKKLNQILTTFCNVGLGYLTLGQSSTSLSGGEAQRLKLSRELAKTTKGHCLYILDEPTTGLHFSDIAVLINAINNLILQGHSVVIIEHNLDVVKMADYIIDLGREGGENGGMVVFSGTPEDIIKCRRSYTGRFLKKYLTQT